ncbi:MAG: cytochrome c oxidase subunit 3 [Bacteroidota bacterium]
MSTMAARYENTNSRIHPLKFALWISMGSIMMMFGAFTSAYIVRRAAGDWLEFQLPNLFFVSTLVILISSLVLHMSFSAFVSGREQRYKNLMIMAFILGVGFVVLQYLGWQELFSIGIDLKGNPSGAFLYMITGVHALHVVGGLVALTIGLLMAFTRPYRITEKRKINFELTLQYWHFVDLLWVYLLLFLFLSR